jgi:protein phosphatase
MGVEEVAVRVLVLSDIHGNADALKVVLEVAPRHDQIWVLGDMVDYGPEPHIVVDLVRGLKPEVVVAGNHDYAVAYNTDCRCGEETHDLSVYTRENISYKLLTREQIGWLRSLEVKSRREYSSRRIYIAHASPRDPLYGYLKPDLPLEKIEEMLYEKPSRFSVGYRRVEADLVVVGHTHIPTSLSIRGTAVYNPGSVGQPRDGDPRASYAILDLDRGGFTVHRVGYDVGKVVGKLRALGLEERFLSRLEYILRSGRVR